MPLVQRHRFLAWIAWWSLATLALGVLYTWLESNTGGIVVATALFHAAGNFARIGPFLDSSPGGFPLDAQPIATLLLVTAAVVVTVAWGAGTLTRPRRSDRFDVGASLVLDRTLRHRTWSVAPAKRAKMMT